MGHTAQFRGTEPSSVMFYKPATKAAISKITQRRQVPKRGQMNEKCCLEDDSKRTVLIFLLV